MMNRKALYISRKVIYRHALLVVPIISIFVVTALTLYEAHRYRQFQRDLGVTQRQLTQLDRLIKDLDNKPPLEVTPVLLQSPTEQPDFIDMLRSRAEANHIDLTRWTNALAVNAAPTNGGSSTPTSGKAALPQGVSAVTCAIEATGRYNDLRHFLYSLQDCPRLFALSDLVWTRNDKYPVTTIKFDLSRYVTVTGTAPVRIPAATKPIASSGKAGHLVVDSKFSTSDAHNSDKTFPSFDYLSGTDGQTTDPSSRGIQ